RGPPDGCRPPPPPAGGRRSPAGQAAGRGRRPRGCRPGDDRRHRRFCRAGAVRPRGRPGRCPAGRRVAGRSGLAPWLIPA
ncbi:MAG: hypothetical protein ACK5Q7_08325, partial [Cyanobacteriota bacterium]